MKLCVITCYKHPDYVRARTLRAAADSIEGVDVLVIKNSQKGLLRYGEVFLNTVAARLRHKPDAYLLTFRGYEMLLPVRLISFGKPLIYDELINAVEWALYEHKKVPMQSPVAWLLHWFYRRLLLATDLILSDTDSHADLSAELTGVPRNKYLTIPVGSDETTFTVSDPEDSEGELFTVLYYGSMLPLHGLQYVIEAAVKLNHQPVKFVLIGGNAKVAHDVAFAVGNGAKIDYKSWVDFEKLPALVRSADLCLAGPFGGTYQSNYVITGKAYQYMAMGRPIVVGENKESHIFRHKREALIVPQADSDALAETILWAMRNRYRLHNIGLAGQKLYERDYTTERLADRLEVGLRRLGLIEPSPRAEGK